MFTRWDLHELYISKPVRCPTEKYVPSGLERVYLGLLNRIVSAR